MFLRWESASRYYLVHVQEDLFGTLTLRRVWGGLGSPRGSQRLEVLQVDQVESRIAALARQRARRGYHVVPTGPCLRPPPP